MPDEQGVLGNVAYDQAFCGIGAGVASTLCMHPLDLLKVKFQVATRSLKNNAAGLASGRTASSMYYSNAIGRQIWHGLRGIVQKDGWQGLYRGLGVNLVGNSASWGAYFLWYTMIKQRKTGNDPSVRLTAPQHLAASVEAGVYSVFLTNPLWVVKTRMFTTSRTTEGAYKGLFDGLYRIARYEGLPGLYKGTVLALVGISNGAIQFMTYEHLKRWAKDRKRRLRGDTSVTGETDPESLSDLDYILYSGSAKLVAIGITYPYQVVRSRMQNEIAMSKEKAKALATTAHQPYTSIMDCVRRTYRVEGLRAFYNGLGPNAVRVIPGTCVTFVVYERLSNFLQAQARAKKHIPEAPQ